MSKDTSTTFIGQNIKTHFENLESSSTIGLCLASIYFTFKDSQSEQLRTFVESDMLSSFSFASPANDFEVEMSKADGQMRAAVRWKTTSSSTLWFCSLLLC